MAQNKILINLKHQNKGFKTLNLDGILYLINDSADELAYHYDKYIYFKPNKLVKLLIS